jgi:small GTP-binding protein
MSNEENKMENEKDDKNENNVDIDFSIITLGESGVGKTSIIKRYVYNKFEPDNLSTIGINFAFKIITLKNNKKAKIKLIDTAGQEKYRSLGKSYFKNAEAVLYIFSHDKENSFDNIKIWKKLFNENNTIEDIPEYLIRNKIDLLEEDNLQEEEKSKIEERYSEESLKDFIKEYKFVKYFSTSAKDEKNNLDEIFKIIAEKCYQKYGKIKDQKNFTLKDRKKKGNIFNNCELCKADTY